MEVNKEKLADINSLGMQNQDKQLTAHKVVPSSLAKLVPITPISLWFMVDITIVFMGFINQLITGGHHPAGNAAI